MKRLAVLAFALALAAPGWAQLKLGAPSGELLEPEKAFRFSSRVADDGAIEVLTRAIAIEPRNTTWWERRSGAKRLSGDLAGAIADLEKALAIDPSRVQVYIGLAFNRKDLGDREGAIRDLERFIMLAPPGQDTRQVWAMIEELRRDPAAWYRDNKLEWPVD